MAKVKKPPALREAAMGAKISKSLSAFANRPLMPAVATFRNELGFQGALINSGEVALRFFEETGKKNADGFPNFVQAQASVCGLTIGFPDFIKARQGAAKWHLVQIYQVSTVFFSALNDEYRRFKQIPQDKWKHTNGKETLPPYQQLLINLPKKNADVIRGQPELQLLEYYRFVRNWVVHPNAETEQAAEKCFSKLNAENSSYFIKHYRSAAPVHPPSKLEFNDFLLFSRAMIHFSPVVSDACDLQNEDIERELFIEKRIILRNHALKQGRIENCASRYYTGKHGGHKILRKEFADYIVRRFREGHYFK